MKRKILIWSAVLTVVFGAALLQSCSSDDDNFATEEYGYYTEEEIDAIMALAEKYESDIEIDRNYYGEKSSLKEIEERLVGMMSLPGDYKLVKEGDSYSFRKKEEEINRVKTRSAEGISLPQVGETSFSSSVVPCVFYLSWRLATKNNPATASLSVNAPYYLYGNSDVIYNAIITYNSISFSETCSVYCGGVRYGRYNISGTYYANGMDTFKIIQIFE